MRSTISVFGSGICALALVAASIGQTQAAASTNDIVSAAARGDTQAVRVLLETEPEVVESTDASGYTALHWAGIRGHWRIFAQLVEAGAPVDAVGADGGTPLHWACHHDEVEMIALLLDAGAEVGVRNRWGRTALHTAARRGCVRVARLLIDRGADLGATTNEGWTPLHVASMADHPELIVLLLSAGADPVAVDDSGLTPAEVARQRPTEVAMEPDRLDDYVGIYDLGGGFSAKVWREGDALKIREFAPDDLYPIGDDRFFCRREPWMAEFIRGDDGSVASIRLHFLRRAVEGVRTLSPRYVGSAACRECHLEPKSVSPYVTWMRSRHGHAYWRLGSDWALFLATLRPHNADLTEPMTDERCLLCHVTARQDDDALLAASFRAEEGIGCESCHGPGSLYMDPEIMADHEAFLANGGMTPTEATCRSCHRRAEDFDFAEMWPKVAHRASDESKE
jgi:hypothetical protein